MNNNNKRDYTGQLVHMCLLSTAERKTIVLARTHIIVYFAHKTKNRKLLNRKVCTLLCMIN